MTDEWIFAKAIELSADRRAEFLDNVFTERPEEQAKLEALIRAHEQSDSLLDTEAMASDKETVTERPLRKTLGDFEIIGELGRGGMGVVYEARQKSLKRKVALKVLSSGLGLSSKAILRFRREAEAAGKLHHTNIVPIYTTGEDHGVHFYAMELIDGPSLDAVIRELRSESNAGGNDGKSDGADELPAWVKETALFVGPQDRPSGQKSGRTRVTSNKQISQSSIASGGGYFDQVATMIAEVADAIDHAHEHGVIHRDIKPSNLLLAPDGRLSINDFGLARMLEQPGMTMSGEFVGSPLYMSPEQITAGRVSLDHRTDIYSLGATLYELLALQPPFPGHTRDQVLSQILHKDAVSPRKLNRKIPVDLDTICMKAIEKDPDRRYQTAGHLADDLRKYVNRHAISARRLGPIGSMIKYAKRNPLAVAFALFIFLTALGGLVGYKVVQDQRLESERERRIEELLDELVSDVFRGVTKDADKLITEAIELHASTDQVEFMRGLKDVFLQHYPEALVHFDEVLSVKEDHIPARSLKAFATLWAGDENAYFEELANIDLSKVKTFEDKFFLGYAYTWGDSVQAEKLLIQADDAEPHHPYVGFLRGVARRNIATLIDHDVRDARRTIDQAFDDITTAARSMEQTPLVLKELTWVRIDRANIYRELIELSPDRIEEYNEVVVTSLAAARNDLQDLLKPGNQLQSDTQYAAVTLLAQLDDQAQLTELADSWYDAKRPVMIYAAHTLAMFFLKRKDYRRARQWMNRFIGPAAENSEFMNLFIELASDQRDFKALRTQAENNVQKKLHSGGTEYIMFDVLFLYLFGKNELVHYRDDRLDDLILDGKLYRPHKEFFSKPASERPTNAEFLEECRSGPAPGVSLMHAHFGLAMLALAENRHADAETYFQEVIKGRQYMMYVHMMSQAMLTHKEDWSEWLRQRSELLESRNSATAPN